MGGGMQKARQKVKALKTILCKDKKIYTAHTPLGKQQKTLVQDANSPPPITFLMTDLGGLAQVWLGFLCRNESSGKLSPSL